MSFALSAYVIVLTVMMLGGCFWLIRWTSKPVSGEADTGQPTGHQWDGLQELNNPLPRWWLWLFYITLIFSIIYLMLYPGLGAFKGLLNWTQEGEYEQEIAQAQAKYGPLFAQFSQQPVATLADNAQAVGIGQRLFATYCTQCHGSDAQGAPGFPNLTDSDWLYGGEAQSIETSILNGRNGVMPAFGEILAEQGVDELAQYVMSLSGRTADAQKVQAGGARFAMCAACHGADAKGNALIGAPNLTDTTWLYGGSAASIAQSIRNGRNGHMPAHKDFLGEDKVHLLATYVYSLRQTP